MENEQSSFNVIHWECNLGQLKKSARFDVQTGVTGGWIDKTAILQFKWRVMCRVENTTPLHFVAENNFVIPDLALFNESKMKALLLKSHDKVNLELGMRTKKIGNIFITDIADNIPDTKISMYCKEFLQALNTP